MALIFSSASHRGTGKIFAGQTLYSALEAYGDLDLPCVADFPLRDVVLTARIHSGLLESVKQNLLNALQAVCSWMQEQKRTGRFPEHYATQHGRDLAARIIINEALNSFFGSYLRSKVDLTEVNANLFYAKDVRLVPLLFKSFLPVITMQQIQREFLTVYQPDASILELTGRVFADSRVFEEDIAARFSLCCGAVILAYQLEGRA